MAEHSLPSSVLRSNPERRSGFERRGHTFPEHLFQAMVELGGGRYLGVQAGMYLLGLEPLVLFDGPSKSTLALKPCDLSSRRVRQAIADKEAEFEKFASETAA